jgi:hypothetical protein
MTSGDPDRKETDHHDRRQYSGSSTDEVVEALVSELNRQGFGEIIIADGGFDPMELAKVAIKAADGDVVPLRGY